MAPRLSSADFQSMTGVGAEILANLEAYAKLLVKWQARINLVGAKTIDDMWRRHFLDSAQLAPLIPGGDGPVIDLGSGAGFPGLVLAILGVGDVVLVESDQKKCAFLAEANRISGENAKIHPGRVEKMAPPRARAVVARACAPLPQLLDYAVPLLKKGGQCLFLKGKKSEAELTEAKKVWNITVTRIPSRSDPSGTILRLEEISHRHGT